MGNHAAFRYNDIKSLQISTNVAVPTYAIVNTILAIKYFKNLVQNSNINLVDIKVKKTQKKYINKIIILFGKKNVKFSLIIVLN